MVNRIIGVFFAFVIFITGYITGVEDHNKDEYINQGRIEVTTQQVVCLPMGFKGVEFEFKCYEMSEFKKLAGQVGGGMKNVK